MLARQFLVQPRFRFRRSLACIPNPVTMASKQVAKANLGAKPAPITDVVPPVSLSGRISFRTDERTHRKIFDAAAKANFKSANAWMEEVLSRAAKEVLGEDETSEITSDSIQHLIQDSEASVELVRDLKPFLEEFKDIYDILRVNAALKKLLTGLDAVKPLLTDEEIKGLVIGVTPLLKEKDSASVLQLNEALKKLVIGLHAIQDFLSNKQTGTLDVLLHIEAMLKNKENSS